MRYFCFILVVLALAACKQKPEPVDNSAPAWYKNQVIYNLDVKVFKDSDGDGIGDFQGLSSRLGYLDTLGITTIWLAPFQPSPLQDDGYDVTDYYAVDPRVGTVADFNSFMQAAKNRNIKVMMDIVLNHSSIQHPWFRTKTDWYLWSAKRPDDWDKGMGFPEVEKQTWKYDSLSKKYYFHRFYHFEPDLNYQNPQVVAEAQRILGFWLNKGVDGFRMDAVPFIIDDPRKSAEHPEHQFQLLHNLVQSVKKIKPDAVLLGEANVKPEETKDYFAKDDEGLDMMLNFEVNEYLFYALATGKAEHLQEALNATAVKPPKDQWAYFLRNHDEIDLGKLSKSEINDVYKSMGPDTNMQLYKRGIRRRLAPMLQNSEARLKQAYSLLFALPGTPALRYGEEIGMGDDLSLKERLAVRTPMQWDTTVNAGFSTGSKTIRPAISGGAFNYRNVNVKQQLADKNSLLQYIRRMIQLRKAHPEIGEGKWQVMDNNNPNCLSLFFGKPGEGLLVVYNFSNQAKKVHLANKGIQELKDLITGNTIQVKEDEVELKPYAGYWFNFPSTGK